MVKTRSHLWLQNLTTEIKALSCSAGTTCAFLAEQGMFGQLILHSWVEIILDPLGIVILMGFVVLCLLVHKGKEVVGSAGTQESI